MSDLKKWDFPVKTPQGFRVDLFFKTMNGALEFLKSAKLIGDNSAIMALDEWTETSKKTIEKEHRSLKKKVLKWLRG